MRTNSNRGFLGGQSPSLVTLIPCLEPPEYRGNVRPSHKPTGVITVYGTFSFVAVVALLSGFAGRFALSLAALIAVYLVATETLPASAATYDVVNDFSLAGNPNGAWSYGVLSSPTGGTFTLYNSTLTDYDFLGERMWYNGMLVDDYYSGVLRNTSGATASWLTNRLPPNLLAMAPEYPSADVRWVAPVSGTYNVSGLFQRIDVTSSQPWSVGVVKGGTTPLFTADNFIIFNDQRPFSFSNLYLPAGTTLDFYAFATGQPTYIGGGLTATITSVPEPSTIALMCAGAIGLLIYGWRKRHYQGRV
jgi:hypothetical protein